MAVGLNKRRGSATETLSVIFVLLVQKEARLNLNEKNSLSHNIIMLVKIWRVLRSTCQRAGNISLSTSPSSLTVFFMNLLQRLSRHRWSSIRLLYVDLMAAKKHLDLVKKDRRKLAAERAWISKEDIASLDARFLIFQTQGFFDNHVSSKPRTNSPTTSPKRPAVNTKMNPFKNDAEPRNATDRNYKIKMSLIRPERRTWEERERCLRDHQRE